MKNICHFAATLCLGLAVFVGTSVDAQSKLLSAYISDSPSSSVPAWIAKETGLFKKYGLEIDLIFIDGSTRGIQSLLAGDLSFTEAVGTSAIQRQDRRRRYRHRQWGSQHIALLRDWQSKHQITGGLKKQNGGGAHTGDGGGFCPAPRAQTGRHSL